MATVIVHDVDDGALERLRAAAEMRGGSVETEVRSFIEEQGRTTGAPDRRVAAEAAVADMRAYREDVRARYGIMPDTLEMLRQERDAW